MTGTLTILGASVRAAVQSARRAGWGTFAIDLFADVDTRACSPAVRVEDYPHGFLRAIAAAPPGPWMYTGGLENHPRLVAAIARDKMLWGNSADVLRRIRDPLAVATVLRQAGLPALDVRRSPPGPGEPRRWLVKPLASCGGGGIEFDDRSGGRVISSGPHVRSRRGRYWQRYCPGLPVAAVFIAHADQAMLLGITRQLIGVDWTGAGGFRYCGSVGPLRINRPLTEQVKRIGEVLTHRFNLRGLFGVDGVISDEEFWTTEVNPRYTASVELLQRAGCTEPVALHAEACTGLLSVSGFSPPQNAAASDDQFAKAIVYAQSDVYVGPQFAEAVNAFNGQSNEPQVADVPPLWQHIPAAQPVATVFATAEGEVEVLSELRRRCEFLRDSLEKLPSPNVNNPTH